MHLSFWLTVHAFLGLFFGLMLVFAPKKLMSASGVVVDNVAQIFTRGVGGAILGLALINWVARNHTDSPLIAAVLGANVLLHFISGWADADATLRKVYTKNGWGSVIFHAVLVVIFGYYLLQQ